MDENTLTIIIMAVLIILLLVVAPLRIRRSANVIIRKFREMKAVDENSARTPEDMGVRLNYAAPSIFGMGDPGQSALTQLREANVILMTSDGHLYLSEVNLSRSKFNPQKS